MKGIVATVVFAVFGLFAFPQAQAVPLTGTEVGNTFGWTPNSTNLLNSESNAPGREGELAPHVLFDSNAIGEVTLNFINLSPALAFFEIRTDGVATGTTAHPVVIGDLIHVGNTVAAGTTETGLMFSALNFVDVRLALGGERDWDFDWVRFEVQAVPIPAALPLFTGGLALLGFFGWRRKRTATA